MSARRVWVWFSLFSLVVFCVGVAGGIVIRQRMGPPDGPRRGPGFGGGPPIGGPGPPASRLLDRLASELDLTPEQTSALEPILDVRRRRLEEIQRSVAVRAEEEQRELQAEIRKVLTPDQQQRFDRWLRESPTGLRGRGPRGRGPGYGR